METPDRNRINTSLSALEDSSSLDRFMDTLSPLKPMKPAYIPPTFNSIFGCPSPTFSFVFKESRLVQCFRHDDPVETKKRRLSFEDETTICLVEEALADSAHAKSNSTELQDNAHQGVSVPDASIIAVDLTGDDGTEFPFGQPQEGSDCPPLLSDDEANSLLPLPAETVASHDANVPNGRQTNSVEGEPKSEGQELNWDSYIDNPTDDVLSFNPDEEIFRPPSMLNQVVDYMSVITQYLLNDESEVDPALPHPDERIAAAADRDHMQRCIGIGRELDQSNNGAQPGGEDLNRISPNPKRRRLNNLESAAGTEGCKRCNCKKSKCLKFYCDCFASGTYCTGPCSCQNCFNQPIYKEIVLEARNKIMIQNPLAFASKIIINPADEIGSDPNKISAPARHKKGCNCKKSSCIKNYCECYQSGVGCSERCRCEGCKNRFGRKDGCATSGT